MRSLLIAAAMMIVITFHQTANADLVANFALNEATWSGAAPQVVDSTGNGHNGTAVGGANTVVDSTFGRVGSFNGNNQYVSVGGSGSITGARTVATWINVNANNLYYGQPIVTGGVAGSGDFFGVAGTGGENSGVGQYHLYIDHYFTSAYSSTVALTPNVWNFVAFTYDGANTVDFYINGQAAGTVVSNGLYNYNINTYDIGGSTIGGTTTYGSLNGLLHGTSIYNSQLTASQISALYTPSAVPEPTSIVMLGSGVLALLTCCGRHRRSIRA